jgi:hypothetical protein
MGNWFRREKLGTEAQRTQRARCRRGPVILTGVKEGGYFKAEEVFGAELIRPSGRAGVRYKSLPEFSRNRKTLILGKGRFRVGRMKSKQLANVLIKIIGLYTCLCAIPSLVVGIAGAIVAASGATKSNDLLSYTSPNAIGAAIQFVVGIFLIGKSRKLAEYWFKNEDEQSHSEPLKEN